MYTILIEGNEGTGKSTIAQQLLNAAPAGKAKIVHFTYADISLAPIARYHQAFTKAITDGIELLILDRGWYSDLVYGQVMRKTTEISTAEIYAIECMVRNQGGGMIMFCQTTGSVGYRRAKARGEDYVNSVEVWLELNEAFKKQMNSAVLPIVNTGCAKK